MRRQWQPGRNRGSGQPRLPLRRWHWEGRPPPAPALISRAVNLAEQLLLILLLRCDISLSGRSPPGRAQNPGLAAPLLRCGAPHRTPGVHPSRGLRSAGVPGVRCACTKPSHYVPPGVVVSLALHLSRPYPGKGPQKAASPIYSTHPGYTPQCHHSAARGEPKRGTLQYPGGRGTQQQWQ